MNIYSKYMIILKTKNNKYNIYIYMCIFIRYTLSIYIFIVNSLYIHNIHIHSTYVDMAILKGTMIINQWLEWCSVFADKPIGLCVFKPRGTPRTIIYTTGSRSLPCIYHVSTVKLVTKQHEHTLAKTGAAAL